MLRRANVSAMILAAGEGKRFGQPKWQATYKGQTFLSIIVEKLLKCELNEIIYVVRKDSMPEEKNAKLVINDHPEEGMISSIYCGVQNTMPVDGFLIFPVDHPFVKLETLQRLIASFQQHPDQLIRPVFDEQNGHPLIVPLIIAKKIPNHDIEGGLKQFLLQEAINFYNVLVDDGGVLKNINFKDDMNENFLIAPELSERIEE